MESSAAGLAALALFVLVLGYWVPQKVRHRQQLLETRLDDRFSEGLRVLAVAARGRVPALATSGAVVADAVDAVANDHGVLTMGSDHQPIKVPVPVRDSATPRGREDLSLTRPRPTRPARGSAREETPMSTTPPGARSRLELLEQRAKRARRRLALTLALLVITLATWGAVVATPLLWFAGLVPTALLLVVLALGRAAAAAARKADARWTAERRAAERKALQVRALAAGGPRAPINRARVTGRAVHGSSTMTQMIPRVAVKVVDGEVDPVVEPVETTHVEAAPVVATPVDATPVDATPVETTPLPTPPRASTTWEPRPVPLPTYVTKPAAPRREPRPLTGMTAPVSTGWSSSPWQRVEDKGEQVGEADTSWSLGGASLSSASLGSTQDAALGRVATPAPATASDTQPEPETSSDDVLATEAPRPRTETLGLPLEQILARRRAAG